MKSRSVVALLLFAVLGIGLIAGCGGGGSSSSSTGEGGGSSSGEFASTAEAACTKADKEIAALGTPQQAEVSEYMEQTETVIEELHEQVQAAAGEGAAEAAYVEGLAEAVPLLNQMTNAARNENFDAVRELSDGLVELNLGELAEAAELKACAEVPVSES
jgi:predicted  nucleic acid-binding Zn-ribbon protein